MTALEDKRTLRFYMAGQGFWFLAHGIYIVAFQAIGTLILKLDATQLGFTQALILLPSLLFTLPAGVFAERNDGRRILVFLHLLAFFPPLYLGLYLLTERLEWHHLIFFGLVMSSIGSFVLPARDAMLSHIVGLDKIQRAVNMALTIQFIAMLSGMLLVMSSAFIHIGWLLFIQAFSFLGGCFVSYRLPKNLAMTAEKSGSLGRHLPEMMDGLKMALAHKDIGPVMFLQFGISVFYIGTFIVLLPLLVRDYYQGSASDIAFLNVLFWTGTIISTAILWRLGRVKSVGRMLASGVSAGLVIIFLLGVEKPYWALALLCMIWGMAAGCSMASGRTIVQNRAPNSHRARILSVYQLSFMGGAPLGAFFIGVLADMFSIHQSPIFAGAGMAIIVVAVIFNTDLLNITLGDEEIENVERTTDFTPEEI